MQFFWAIFQINLKKKSCKFSNVLAIYMTINAFMMGQINFGKMYFFHVRVLC